jgi:hypothetical protein
MRSERDTTAQPSRLSMPDAGSFSSSWAYARPRGTVELPVADWKSGAMAGRTS